MIWYTILFYAICVCKTFQKQFFPFNAVYIYTVYNLNINVLLLGQHVEKRIVIMGVINGQIFINISNTL